MDKALTAPQMLWCCSTGAEHAEQGSCETLGGERESGDLSLRLFKERPMPRVQFMLVIISLQSLPHAPKHILLPGIQNATQASA